MMWALIPSSTCLSAGRSAGASKASRQGRGTRPAPARSASSASRYRSAKATSQASTQWSSSKTPRWIASPTAAVVRWYIERNSRRASWAGVNASRRLCIESTTAATAPGPADDMRSVWRVWCRARRCEPGVGSLPSAQMTTQSPARPPRRIGNDQTGPSRADPEGGVDGTGTVRKEALREVRGSWGGRVEL